MMESVPDFDEVFASARKTSAEVKEILDNFLNSEESFAAAEAPTSATSTTSVDKAFSELLG